MIRIICLLLLLFLSSCDLKPPYYSPCYDTPVCWRFSTSCEEMENYANLRWWEELGDPILNALIVEALQNNEDLHIATTRLCEFYALFKITRSALFPHIDAEASWRRQGFTTPEDFSFATEPISSTSNRFTLAMLLTYELDFWYRIANATEAAFMDFLAQTSARRTVILSLVSSVATSYIQLRQYDLQYQISMKTLKDRQEFVRLAKLRFEGGLTSEMELMQAEVERDNAAAALEQFQIQIAQTENLLSVLVGTNPTCILRGRELSEFNLPLDVPVGIPSQVLCNRPDIVEVEQNIMAANARVGEARARFFPAVSLTGVFGFASDELRNLFSSKFWEFDIAARQVVFDGGRICAQLQLAKIQKLQAQHEYVLAVQTAFKEVEDALIDHSLSKEIRKVYTSQVKSAAEYLRLAWLQYNEGLTDYLDVINAEQRLFDSELNLANAQGDVFITLVSIYKALGGGWVIDADRNYTIDYSGNCCPK